VAPAAFARRRPGARTVALAGTSMGTSWSARLVDPPPDAAARIDAVLDEVVAEMSHWAAGSALARFNQEAIGDWVDLPAGMTQVLAAAAQVSAESDGAFDPAMGALVDLWGFGPPGPCARPPAGDAIAAARARSGLSRIELAGTRARRLADVRLDLSGIAKGHAVDRVCEMLRSIGVTDALIEVGGELRGMGVRPDGQPWWVALEPVPGAPFAPLRVALHELAVASSGDQVRAFVHAGRRYSHSLDPRTGEPIANGVVAVSVLHPCCMLADAWATALTVLGPTGMAAAERHGLAARMVVRNGGEWAELLSPMLRSMMDD
jgi:FAD:protein FMN transferase